ncbi:MAG TPA: hypothetical protein VLX28_01870, partial [Thermoanaerobaculia bacterium]|nr:hypothetical protein [Thermoanaerobaculia bacterium]
MERDAARPVSHRRRFLAGLAAAALLAAGVGALLLQGSQKADRRARAERQAVVTLSALTDLVDRAGGGAAGAPAPQASAPAPAAETGGMGLGAEIAAVEQQGQAQPAGDAGDAVRRVVARFAAGHPEVKAIRIVDFEGFQLTASTAAADSDAKAAPRRLEREEKDLYDLGQKLRAAVQGNREGAEGAARQAEIAVLQ